MNPFSQGHPRRSIEAWWNQFIETKFLEDHQVPRDLTSWVQVRDFFQPLLEAEENEHEQ